MKPEHPIRVAAVSYVNTYPFLHGLHNDATLMESIGLRLETPSECARLMLSGEADLGLIPVAVIPQMKEAHIVTGFCIGADGPVDSVCLFSEVPLKDVTGILLDFQSRTSVMLMRVLAQHHFHITPEWRDAGEGFIDRIAGPTAGIVIGDRAFPLRTRFPVVIDLAEEWKALTGLPFVFACWVSNRPLPTEFLDRFNAALQYGVAHRQDAIVNRSMPNEQDMIAYVNHRVSYTLDERKREALQLFTRWSGMV
ncbi:MAG: menaquinone biosynthesis protein [Flavobacteriales bacterium]|nr:menaquinone biosynthesis protein [Flavobacteriales bacterium]